MLSTMKIRAVILAIAGTICLVDCTRGPSEHQPVRGGSDGARKLDAGPSFDSIFPVISQRCARCHNTGTNDWTKEDNLRRVTMSGALELRLSAGTMPQPGSPEAGAISKEERQTILDWARALTAKRTSGGSGDQPVTPPSPNLVDDRNLAVLIKCSSCHGMNGLSSSADIPNLASHSKTYLMNRMSGFLLPGATGTMPANLSGIFQSHGVSTSIGADPKAPVVNADASALLNYIADFYSNLYVGPTADEMSSRQAKFNADENALYAAGKKLVIDNSCTGCHLQPDFRPMDGMPMVFAQKEKYLSARLEEFRKGTGGETMPGVVASFSDDDIRAVSLYLSNTHPTRGPTP